MDTLNLKMPAYGFQMVGASHVYSVSLKGNVVTWVFDNINLKRKSKDINGSKGYIVFDAKVKGSLKTGDSIMNKANIYFDYNDPIETKGAVVKREGIDKDFDVPSNIQ